MTAKWYGKLNLKSALTELTKRFIGHGIGKTSAALAYYMFFALFPLLVFVSMLIGALELPREQIMASLASMLTPEVYDIINGYLTYTEQTNGALMFFGLAFTLYFFSRVTNQLQRAVNSAYHVKKQESLVRHYIKVVAYALGIMLTIVASLLIIALNTRLLGLFSGISPEFMALWQYLRYIILAVLLFILLALLYGITPYRRLKLRFILPGAGAALVSWLVISWLFGFYVENMGRYSLLYGSLGGIMILLLWLYLSAQIILLGAELNGVLQCAAKAADASTYVKCA